MRDTFGLLAACGRAICARAARDAVAEANARAGIAVALTTCGVGILDAAAAHGMEPLVTQLLCDIGGPGIPDALRGEALARRRAGAVRALAAVRTLGDVLAVLADAGIVAWAYKGPALAADAYGDPSLRDPADVDIVVAARDAGAAAAALARAQFAPAFGLTVESAFRLWRAQGHITLRRAGELHPVELHWRVCERRLPWTLDSTRVHAASRHVDLGSSRVVVPSAPDQVVLVLLHAARHGWDQLESLVAATALLARGADAPAVASAARQLQGVRATSVGLCAMRRLLGAVLPPPLDALADAAPHRLVADALARVHEGTVGTRRDWRLHLRLLDDWPSRARYIGWSALTTQPTDRLAVPLPAALSWLYPPLRLARVAARAMGFRATGARR